MCLMFLFSVLLVCAAICIGGDVQTTFNTFQLQHNKVYNSAAELSLRQQIFESNLLKIEEHNRLYEQGLVTYTMGVNQFSDMTPEEFSSMLGTQTLTNARLNVDDSGDERLSENELPESIDWRDKGVVTAVKNQGTCGSCWAFSTTGTLESHLAIKEGVLVSLSEQQLIDCDTDVNNACYGGVIQVAYEYVIKNGLAKEDDYPYAEKQNSKCSKVKQKAVKLESYRNIASYNETELKLAVGLIGPVSVAVDANPIQSYQSGIYSGEACTTDVNHGILAVGYGTDNVTGLNYWILKNSWGPAWGEAGYYRMEMGKGLCGIASQACYPVGTKSGSSRVSRGSGLVLITVGLIYKMLSF